MEMLTKTNDRFLARYLPLPSMLTWMPYCGEMRWRIPGDWAKPEGWLRATRLSARNMNPAVTMDEPAACWPDLFGEEPRVCDITPMLVATRESGCTHASLEPSKCPIGTGSAPTWILLID